MRYMKYIKFTCSNGYAGCDEEFYEKIEDDADIDWIATEILENQYSFSEPDGRFLAHSSGFGDEDYPEYDADYDEYKENLYVEWDEVTEEEYEENQ